MGRHPTRLEAGIVTDQTPADRAVALLRWLAVPLSRTQPDLSERCARAARELAEFEALRVAFDRGSCARCGGPIENAQRGRRRTYCRTCKPPRVRNAREIRDRDGMGS